MKILYNTAGELPVLSRTGGAIEKLVGEQIKRLSGRHNITLVGDIDVELPGLKVVRFRKRYGENVLQLLFHSFRLVRRMLSINTDIVVSTHLRNLLPSILYCKLKRKPLIAWEYDHVMWVKPYTLRKRIYHRLVSCADLIVTVSDIQKERMLQVGIRDSKIRVVYNAVDIEKYHPTDRSSVELPSCRYILYVAKMTPRKNQLGLLKAFKQIKEANEYKNLKLVLVGPKRSAFRGRDVPSEYYNECVHFVDANGLSKEVVFKENISEEELIRTYQNAELFVCPSTEEGFGLILLEAMACGLPCIANNIEPLSEVLGSAGMLTDATNADQLAKDMQRLLTDAKLRQALAEKARHPAESCFSWGVIIKEVENVMTSFCHG